MVLISININGCVTAVAIAASSRPCWRRLIFLNRINLRKYIVRKRKDIQVGEKRANEGDVNRASTEKIFRTPSRTVRACFRKPIKFCSTKIGGGGGGARISRVTSFAAEEFSSCRFINLLLGAQNERIREKDCEDRGEQGEGERNWRLTIAPMGYTRT